MKHLFIFLSLLLLGSQAFAQKTLEIKGRFVDESNKAVPFMSFTLYQGEATVSKHVANKEGRFKLMLTKGDYTLKTDSTFYAGQIQKITVIGKQDLGDIRVTAKQLEGVEIEGAAEPDNPNTTTFDVSSLGLPEGVPMMSIAGLVPSLTPENGSFKLQDKEVEFFLDGKKISAQTYNNLPASAIQSLEMTYNPPLTANIGKKAMINVIMKPDTFISQTIVDYSHDILQPKYAPYLDYTLKNKKTFLNASLQYTYDEGKHKYSTLATHGDQFVFEDQVEGRGHLSLPLMMVDYFQKLNKGWEINTKLYYQIIDTEGESNNTFRRRDQPTQYFQNKNSTSTPSQYGMLELIKRFSPKSKLNVNGRLHHQKSESKNENLLQYQNISDSKTLYFQALHSLRFKKINRVEYGVFYAKSFTESDFKTQREGVSLSQGQMDVDRSTLSFIASASKTFKNGITLMLESKISREDAHIQHAKGTRDNDFYNFVPQVSLSKRLKKYGTLNLFYTYELTRPNANSFNDYRLGSSALNESAGNTALQNEKYHSVYLSHRYMSQKFWVQSYLRFQYLGDRILYKTTVIDDIFLRQYQNIDYYNSITTSVNLTYKPIKLLSFKLGGNLSRVEYGDPADNAFNDQRLFGSINSSVTYIVKGWTLSINGRYTPYKIAYQTKDKNIVSAYLSVRKSLLKSRLSIKASASFSNTNQSILDNYQYRKVSKYTPIFQNLGLSISYRFGKVINKDRYMKGFKGD